MWSIVNGTIVNAATVIIGSCAGLTLGRKLPDRYQNIVLNCLGLVTITLGVDAGVLEFSKTVAKFVDEYNWVVITNEVKVPPAWHP